MEVQKNQRIKKKRKRGEANSKERVVNYSKRRKQP